MLFACGRGLPWVRIVVGDFAMNVAVFVEESSDAWLVRFLHRHHRSALQTLVVETAVVALLPDTFAGVVHVEVPDSSNGQDVAAVVAVFVLDAVVAAAGTSVFVHSMEACADMQSIEERIHTASVEAVVLADEDDLEEPDSSLCGERAFPLLM